MHTAPPITGLRGTDLLFDGARHEYRLSTTGQVVPSVTQVLAAVGVSTDFEALRTSARRAEQIDTKRDLGHALHADAHAYDDDDLDWTSVHPDVKPYLEAWIAFRINQRLFPIQRERRVYCWSLNVCGTLDGVFYRDDRPGRHILIDIKTGDPEDAGAQFQTAGYELLWASEHPEQPIAERWAVQLDPSLAVPYRITNYSAMPDAWLHAQKFRAFVTTYWEQAARRRR